MKRLMAQAVVVLLMVCVSAWVAFRAPTLLAVCLGSAGALSIVRTLVAQRRRP